AYSRLRAQEGPVRGARRRVSARRPRGGRARVRDPRDDQYARVLVEPGVDVQRGWQVVAAASPLAHPLLDEVCRALARRGAYALARPLYAVGMTPSEWIKEAPDDLLRRQAPLEEHVLMQADAFIA